MTCMTQYSYIFIAFASTRIIKLILDSSPKNIFSIPSIFVICIVVWNYINVYRDQTKPIHAIMKANNQTWPGLSEIIFHHRYYFENLKLKIVGHCQPNHMAFQWQGRIHGGGSGGGFGGGMPETNITVSQFFIITLVWSAKYPNFSILFYFHIQ